MMQEKWARGSSKSDKTTGKGDPRLSTKVYVKAENRRRTVRCGCTVCPKGRAGN